jgi:iron(III) transport system permease protein
MWGLRSSRTFVIGAAIAAFVAFCVLPFAYMVALSVVGTTGTASSYAALVLDPRQRALLSNTALLGGGTAFVATVIGAPLGVALARVPVPRKLPLRILLTTPVLLPPYVVGLAWTYLGGRAGLVARMAGADVLSDWTYSLPGAILVLGLVFYPLSMLATEVAVRRVEPRLEEAALVVATPGRVLRYITLPLAAPSIVAAALVIFVLAVSEFGVPGLLRVRVFTTEVFTAFAALYDFGRATILALPLLILSIIAAAITATVMKERLLATRRGATGAPPMMFDAWRPHATVAAIGVLIVALVLPIAVLVAEALDVPSWSEVVEGSRAAIRNSLVLATFGATLVLVVAVWLGYARARMQAWPGLIADMLLVVLFAVPSTVVGIGLIGLWNRPGVVGSLYGTDAMLLLGYLARFVPLAALAIGAHVRQVPLSHEEAAAVAGAGWARSMARIILPQLTLGLFITWVVVFILAFGELGASILVAPPGEATLPIRTYTIIANAPSAHVAALALLQSAVIFCPLVLLGLAVAARGRP